MKKVTRLLPRLGCIVGGGVVAFCAVTSPAASQSSVRWHYDSMEGDVTFSLPVNAVYLPQDQVVVVADYLAADLAVLDARTGAVVRRVGREGDGPGEFRKPGRVIASLDHALFGVWDFARRTVEVFDHSFTPVSRIAIGGIYGPRGGVLLSDSTAVVSGGRLIAQGLLSSLVWASPGRHVTGGPPAPGHPIPGNTEHFRAQYQITGGPMAVTPNGLVMAQAASGDIWRVTQDGQERVAFGPGMSEDLLEHYWKRVSVNGREGIQAWTTFPHAMFLESEDNGSSFLLGWAEEDGFTFYRVRAGQPPQRLASLPPYVYEVVRLSDDEFLIMSYAERGEYRIERRQVELTPP